MNATIQFTCPYCAFSKQLPASAVGMQGNCPSCNAGVIVSVNAQPSNPIPPSNVNHVTVHPINEEAVTASVNILPRKNASSFSGTRVALAVLVFVAVAAIPFWTVYRMNNPAEEKWVPEVMDRNLNEIYSAFVWESEFDRREFINKLSYKKFEDWRGEVVSKDGNIYGVKLLYWKVPERMQRLPDWQDPDFKPFLIPLPVRYQATNGGSWNVGDGIGISGTLYGVSLSHDVPNELKIPATEPLYPGHMEICTGLWFNLKIDSAR
jgi:hypothetical protein